MSSNDINEIFDHGARVIIELGKELEQLAAKFGPDSALVLRKSEQLAKLRLFYDSAGEAIKGYSKALSFATINYRALELVVTKYETGLSYAKLAKINGFDEMSARDLDAVFEFWKKQKKELDNIHKLAKK